MGTSYIGYKKHGFWIKDAFLEGLYFLLAREFKKFNENEGRQNELIDKLMQAATIGYSGCIPSYIEEYFTTKEKISLLKKTLENIIYGLEKDETFFTISELNDNNIGHGGWQSINLKGFRNSAQLMLNLIEEKLKTDASSPIDYWDFNE